MTPLGGTGGNQLTTVSSDTVISLTISATVNESHMIVHLSAFRDMLQKFWKAVHKILTTKQHENLQLLDFVVMTIISNKNRGFFANHS